MLLVTRSDIFVNIFRALKISELGKYISYCTLSRAITITYTLRAETFAGIKFRVFRVF